MIAANIMSFPEVVLAPGGSVDDALRLFAEGPAREVPVVDPEGVLLGLVTTAGLLDAVLEGGGGQRILDCMERDIPAIFPDVPASEVFSFFMKIPSTSLFVADNRGRLLGVISPTEIFKRLWEYRKRKKD